VLKDLLKDLEANVVPIRQHLPQVLVVLSLALYAVAVNWEQAEDFKAPALAILASGFFSWLTKSLVFKQSLREELTEILYSARHLSLDSPRLRYLENTLVASGLPEAVAKSAAPIFVGRLFSRDNPYFYTTLHRKIDLLWKDRDKGVVSVKLTNRYILESLSPDSPIVMKGSWRCTEKLKGVIPKIECIRVTPKDLDVDEVLIENKPFDPIPPLDEGGSLNYGWEVILPAGKSFAVEAVFSYAQDIDDDNTIMWEAVVFSEGMELDYTCPDNMAVYFASIGKAEYQPINGGRKQHCRALILPGEGYILTMQRKQEN